MNFSFLLKISFSSAHICDILYLVNEYNSDDDKEDQCLNAGKSKIITKKRKVNSLSAALDAENYAPYEPPRREERIHGIIHDGKRKRDGTKIKEEKITFSNIEPKRKDSQAVVSNTPGVALYAKVSFDLEFKLALTNMRFLISRNRRNLLIRCCF